MVRAVGAYPLPALVLIRVLPATGSIRYAGRCLRAPSVGGRARRWLVLRRLLHGLPFAPTPTNCMHAGRPALGI